MDKITFLQENIKAVLEEYAAYKVSNMNLENVIIADEQRQHYQLVRIGWHEGKHIYHVVFHVDIINDKIWIQEDNTEISVANMLLEKEVAKSDIVLAYQSEAERRLSGFAVG